MQANNTTLSPDEIEWVTTHAQYWGYRRGYERSHRHAGQMLRAGAEANLSAAPRSDADKELAKKWDFGGIWNDLWYFYGWNKWKPMRSEIEDNFSKKWDAGYDAK